MVHEGIPATSAACHCPHEGNVRCHRPQWLHRMLRGDPGHGFHGFESAHHCAHAGDCRKERSRDSAFSRRKNPKADQECEACESRSGTHRKRRTAGALYGHRYRFPQ